MLIQTKSGVHLGEINDVFMDFITVLDEIGAKWGFVPMITSGCDGKHMEGSYHYEHRAWDIRIWNMKNPASVAEDLRKGYEEIGGSWDVLWGDEHHKDHMHIEKNKE